MINAPIRASLALLLASTLLLPLAAFARQASPAHLHHARCADTTASGPDDFRPAADGGATAAARLRGRWIVESTLGVDDEWLPGTTFEFTANQVHIVSPAGSDDTYDDEEVTFQANEHQILMDDDVLIEYRLRDNTLTLRIREMNVRVILKREMGAFLGS